MMWVLIVSLAAFVISSCDLNTPTLPERTNPMDGRKVDADPRLISVKVGRGLGYATNPVLLNLDWYDANSMQICEVQGPDDQFSDTAWIDISRTHLKNVMPNEGEHWIGCKIKAENGNVSESVYVSFYLDTSLSIKNLDISDSSSLRYPLSIILTLNRDK